MHPHITRQRFWISSVVLVLLAASGEALAAGEQQHLDPEDYRPDLILDPSLQWDNPSAYEGLVRYKLVNPKPSFGFDALMICEESFEKEWAVAVDQTEDSQGSVVRFREMNQRIWGAKKGAKLTFLELAAPIDDVTAATVRHCWARILGETRYALPRPGDIERITLDGTTFHFSSWGRSGQIYAPHDKSFPSRMAALGYALRDYVKDVESSRAKLAEQIRRDAETLSHDIDSWPDRIVRLRDDSRRQLLAHRHRVDVVLFAPDGKSVLTASMGKVMLWDASTGEALADFSRDKSKVSVLGGFFAPDSTAVAVTMLWRDGAKTLWNLRSGREMYSIPPGSKQVVAMQRLLIDANIVLTAGSDGAALWDGRTGKLVREIPVQGHFIGDAAFSVDGGRIIAGADDGRIRIFETNSARQVGEFSTGSKGIDRLLVSPDGSQLLVVSGDTHIALWDFSGKQMGSAPDHDQKIIGAAFTSRGIRFATTGDDHGIRVWNFDAVKPMADLAGHMAVVYAAAFSPDGKVLVTGSEDETARVWNAPDSPPN